MRYCKFGALMIVIAALLVGSVYGEVFSMMKASSATCEDSVVMIRCVKQSFDYATPWKQLGMGHGTGSGFVIEGNRILTNAHNIADYRFVEVKKQNLAKRYIGQITFAAHDCDLAIIEIADKSFFDGTSPLELGSLPESNTTVQTYGFPMGGKHVSVTEGVVSRLQLGIYSHTQADSHLQVQTDAAINPGNSGGPVLQNGKVVGVAFQGMTQADNIGYMIPTTVIEHFLADIADGKYDGFGSLGFSMFPGLHNKSYADYLKVPLGQEGIVILTVQQNSTAEKLLKPGDVLTKVGQHDIDNDGMIKIYGLTLNMSEAIEQKQIGEELEVTFYRNGVEQTGKIEVALNKPVLGYSREYDKRPQYKVFAGLTFVPVTRNFLETWGGNWIGGLPHYLWYLFIDSEYLNEDRDRKEYVVLSEILADEVNSYAAGFKFKVVESVNGIEIMSLADLNEAFDKTVNGFCEIQFMGASTPLILDSDMAMSRHGSILEKYQIPSDSYLETK